MKARYDALAGLRILVLEDEMLIAMQLEDMLRELGCGIAGAAGCVEDAIALVRNSPLDGALLDGNLHGRSSLPVAEELVRLQVPFLLVTGYNDTDSHPGAFLMASRVRKPFTITQLADGMMATFSPSLETAN